MVSGWLILNWSSSKPEQRRLKITPRGSPSWLYRRHSGQLTMRDLEAGRLSEEGLPSGAPEAYVCFSVSFRITPHAEVASHSPLFWWHSLSSKRHFPPLFLHFPFYGPRATSHMPHPGISTGSGPPRRQVVLLEPAPAGLAKGGLPLRIEKEKSGTGKNRFFKQSVVARSLVGRVRYLRLRRRTVSCMIPTRRIGALLQDQPV